MFKIYDGREHFYQWDLDRKLIVEDPAIVEVHFCNRTDNCSLVCETYVEDGITLVNVPNVLLQSDWKIHVYAYDGRHTKFAVSYDVASRTKPADYAYTETEILNWSKIDEKITTVIEEVNAAEAIRATAEEERIANENSRALLETERINNEAERQAAETNRANEYSNLVEETTRVNEEADNTLQEVQTALINVNAATDNANAATTLATNAATGANKAAEAAHKATAEAEEATEAAAIAANTATKATEDAMDATEAANNATEAANNATGKANTAAGVANNAADNANEARESIVDITSTVGNALKGKVEGIEYVVLSDISPILHDITVTEDVGGVYMVRMGKNIFDYKAFVNYCNGNGGSGATETVMYLGEECFSYKVAPRDTTLRFLMDGIQENTQYTLTMEYAIAAYDGNEAYEVPPLYIYYTDGGMDRIQPMAYANKFIKYTYTTRARKTVLGFRIPGFDNRATIYVKKNIQFEIGAASTEFMPYVEPVKYYSNGDPIKIPSLYPTTVVAGDNAANLGITAEYNRDINKAFAELQQAIISLGGNV